MRLLPALCAVAVLLAGCRAAECDLASPACDDGLVCEASEGEATGRCYEPVRISGRVVDFDDTGKGIAGAVVVGVNAEGRPVDVQQVTPESGEFTLRVPSLRGEDGKPASGKVTLRVSAPNYTDLPGGLRDAISVETPGEGEVGKGYTAQAPELALNALPQAEWNRSTVTGTVAPAEEGRAVLVVADRGTDGTGYAGLSDAEGKYTLFNVQPGTYELRGHAQGSAYTPVSIDLQTVTATADLARATLTPPPVQGVVRLLTATGQRTAAAGPVTVALVPAALALIGPERGEVPFGLERSGVSGSFEFTGVPDGVYRVWAGRPGEGNVVADVNQLTVTVSDGVPSAQLALDVIGSVQQTSPGVGQITDVGVRPIYAWTPYPGASAYVISVFDARGRQARDNQLVISGSAASVQSDADLPPGLYQWRVRAYAGFTEIARSDPGAALFRVR